MGKTNCRRTQGRAALIHAVEKALAMAGDVHANVAQQYAAVSAFWISLPIRPGEYVPPAVQGAAPNGSTSGPALISSMGHWQWRAPGRSIPSDHSHSTRFVFERYLRGANPLMPWRDFYSNDRYFQIHAGLPYLEGWRSANLDQRLEFADHLTPLDRTLLLHSLGIITHSYGSRGDLFTSASAREMASYIRTRFNIQLALMTNEQTAEDVRQAYAATLDWNLLGPQPTGFNLLPHSIRVFAAARANEAMRQYLVDNPFIVRYQPQLLGLAFLDRLVLTASDLLSPIVNTALRLYSSKPWQRV